MIGLLNPTTGALSNYETSPEEYTFVKGERYYFSAMMIRMRYSPAAGNFAGNIEETGLFETQTKDIVIPASGAGSDIIRIWFTEDE